MKRYAVRKPVPQDVQEALAPYPPLLQTLLYNRGIADTETAERFLKPDFERDLHDPFLLPNMEAAVERIKRAIEAREPITIYADYDADGVPGAVMLFEFFRKGGVAHVDVYIPHRNREGFGVNVAAVTQLKERGTSLMITLDCGIADVAAVAHARSLGIDVVLTDHHEPHDEVPDAIVVNHKMPQSEYPERILCGTGVAFKLIQALIARQVVPYAPGTEKWLLDLVGIATMSDMVPLVGENRALAHYGLLVLQKTRRPGLLQLFKKTGTKQSYITETDVGFTISPRINAASRMGEPEVAFHMLATTDEVVALEHVEHLHHINDMRKGHVAAIVKAVHKRMEEQKHHECPVVVAGHPDWQPSLLGLAASSIAEHYGKPTFLWGRGDGTELKGSCRTAGGMSTLAIMRAVEGTFDAYGGHDQAGGFVVSREHVDLLEQALADGFQRVALEKNEEPQWVDALLRPEDVSFATYRTIRQLAPFGVANPEPLFMLQSVLVKQVEMFGKTKEHLRLVLHRETGGDVEAIAFYTNVSKLTRTCAPGDRRDIVATLDKNMWGGRQSVRLRLLDVL